MTPADLRQWREQASLSQTSLARLLGTYQNTVSRWELGTRSIPPYLGFALDSLRGEPSMKCDDPRDTLLTAQGVTIHKLRAALKDIRFQVSGVNPVGRANGIRLATALSLIDDAITQSSGVPQAAVGRER